MKSCYLPSFCVENEKKEDKSTLFNMIVLNSSEDSLGTDSVDKGDGSIVDGTKNKSKKKKKPSKYERLQRKYKAQKVELEELRLKFEKAAMEKIETQK